MASAADVYGDALVGILLTGANADGAAGMAEIHDKGGFTVVQDPVEAQVATMPRAAIAASAPDLILPLAAIGRLLQSLVMGEAPEQQQTDNATTAEQGQKRKVEKP
jgi:two-component system chemotaxis response regulator CheB